MRFGILWCIFYRKRVNEEATTFFEITEGTFFSTGPPAIDIRVDLNIIPLSTRY